MTHDAKELSDAKRALLEKIVREGFPRVTKENEAGSQHLPATFNAQFDTNFRTPAIAIQSGGSKVPFFFPHVHWQAGPMYCFTLAHELGPDQPFYIVDPYRFEGLQTLPSLEDIAAECVKSVRAIQPDGPYRLGGECGAGFIVYEMAQQLHAAGQQVEKLVMIEPGVGPYYAPLLIWAGKGARALGALLGSTSDRQLSWFLHVRHLYKLMRYPEYRHVHGFSLAPQSELLRKEWLATYIWILSAYVPRAYPGTVTYFWAQDRTHSNRDWWRKTFVARETEVYSISGNRHNCISSHVHDLAVQLRVWLSHP
jgi:Thioesterase domain